MILRAFTSLSLLVCFSAVAFAQQGMPAQAYKNVTIHKEDGSVLSSSTIVWRDGVIESVGGSIPFDAFVHDGGDSLHIFPAFIEGVAAWGSPKEKKFSDRAPDPGNPTYERAGIQPHLNPSKLSQLDEKTRDLILKTGYGSFNAALEGKMMPGRIDFMYVSESGLHLSSQNHGLLVEFDRADVYPNTLMGIMTRMRQLWNDGSALMEHQNLYASNPSEYPVPTRDEVLESLFPVINKEIPVYFVADEKEMIERVLKLKKELDFNLILVSAKEGYKIADRLKKENISVLASLDFPKNPDPKKKESKKDSAEVKKELSAEHEAFLNRKKEAYAEILSNIQMLKSAGIPVGATTYGMKLSEFPSQIEKLKEVGYESNMLLSLLTIDTSKILGTDNRIGKIAKGYSASFVVTSGDIFEKESKILANISPFSTKKFEFEKKGKSKGNKNLESK